MSSELVDALVWNRPALEKAESKGAKAFIDAMCLRAIRDEPDPEDPLGIAAQAILDEVSGNDQAAQEAHARLTGSNTDEVRLLGLCLRCWSQLSSRPELVDEAQGQIEQFDDEELRARLTMKLVSAAFDHRWDDLLPRLLSQAQEWAPSGSMLAAAVRSEKFNLIGGPLDPAHEFEPDDLTEYTWIRDLVAEAARDAVEKAVERRARSPWTLVFGFGASDLNRPYAAEIQARWAGASWLRNQVQGQLASHLLGGAASSAGEYASAVALWGLSHQSSKIKDVVDLAEPHFDSESADFIVGHLTRANPVAVRFDPRLLEAALECWDLISSDTATNLLDRFKPVQSEHPTAQRIAALWSVLSIRVPDDWYPRFADLSDEDAESLVATTTPEVAARMPLEGARRLFELNQEPDDSSAILLKAALASRLGVDYKVEPNVPAFVLVRLAAADYVPRDGPELQRAVSDLTKEAADVISDARGGTGGMGSYSTLPTLGRAVALSRQMPAPANELLVEAATDAHLPRHVRYEAVKALAISAAEQVFVPSDISGLLKAIPEAGAEPFWDEYSPSLMQAVKAELATASGEVLSQVPILLSLSRDPEPRVRMDAIDASVLGRRASSDEMLESILINGLFDPRDSVVQRAVSGFKEIPPRHPAAQTALASRLSKLFDHGNRDVRVAIADLAFTATAPPELARAARALRERASADRSYEVRNAVADDPQP